MSDDIHPSRLKSRGRAKARAKAKEKAKDVVGQEKGNGRETENEKAGSIPLTGTIQEPAGQDDDEVSVPF